MSAHVPPGPGQRQRGASDACWRCARRLRKGQPIDGAESHPWRDTTGRPCVTCGVPTVHAHRTLLPGHRRRATATHCDTCYRALRRADKRRRAPAGPPLTDDQRLSVALLLHQAPDLVDALGLNDAAPTVSLDKELAHFTGVARGFRARMTHERR